MYKLEITLTDELAEKLKAKAAEANLSPEAFAAASVEQSLEVEDTPFVKTAKYILKKNTELYKRLA